MPHQFISMLPYVATLLVMMFALRWAQHPGLPRAQLRPREPALDLAQRAATETVPPASRPWAGGTAVFWAANEPLGNM